MAYEQRENTGSMFVNDKKETENHPDRTGSALIGGVEYWVSGWIKESAKGKWMSLAFKPKDAKPSKPDPKASTGTPGDRFGDFEGDIPFDRIRSEYSVS